MGRLVRAHGLHGEVAVEVRTDEPERRFAAGTVLKLRRPAPSAVPPPPLPATLPPALTVSSSRWHQDRLLVRFQELGDRETAEAARGLVLHVPVRPGERPEDTEEFYDHQLRGLAVVTTDGVPSGSVADVLHTGGQDLLVVRREGRADVLVPFVAALVPEVDLETGRLVVADRPGLLEPLPEDADDADDEPEG